MNDNLKFWVSTLSTAILYYFAFSFATTGIIHVFFILSGSIALLATVYYLSKQKLRGLVTFIRCLIYKGRG